MKTLLFLVFFPFSFISFGDTEVPAVDKEDRLIACWQGTCTTIDDGADCDTVILLDGDDNCTGGAYGCGGDYTDDSDCQP
jgi:hypothetical protein